MNAHAFRHFYNYHFAENRTLWDSYIRQLTYEQFTQPVPYSIGSVRDQLIHLMNVDEVWFSDLSHVEPPESYEPADLDDRALIRARWDDVEHRMRAYLHSLQDETLLTKPFPAGEDEELLLWQVLLHVANHGTDHRAQILRLLSDLGVKTTSQDYIFYVYDNPS